jgi:hypothetical protein
MNEPTKSGLAGILSAFLSSTGFWIAGALIFSFSYLKCTHEKLIIKTPQGLYTVDVSPAHINWAIYLKEANNEIRGCKAVCNAHTPPEFPTIGGYDAENRPYYVCRAKHDNTCLSGLNILSLGKRIMRAAAVLSSVMAANRMC